MDAAGLAPISSIVNKNNRTWNACSSTRGRREGLLLELEGGGRSESGAMA